MVVRDALLVISSDQPQLPTNHLFLPQPRLNPLPCPLLHQFTVLHSFTHTGVLITMLLVASTPTDSTSINLLLILATIPTLADLPTTPPLQALFKSLAAPLTNPTTAMAILDTSTLLNLTGA